MDSPATSELRFWSLAGHPIEGPREWREAWLELPVPVDAWEDVSATLQGISLDVSLRRMAGRARVVALWPRSDPGRYLVRVRGGGVALDETLEIRPEKISPQAFEALIEELQGPLPQAVAIALQRGGALTGVTFMPPERTTMADEVMRLELAVDGTGARPGLAELLPVLASDPHSVLAERSVVVPALRARRPHPARIAWAARPSNLEDRRPREVVEQRVEHDVDVYENRLVKVFVVQVRQRLLRLLAAGLPSGLRERVARLHNRLRRAERRASFLERVSLPRFLPQRTSMVLLRVPPYRAAFEGWLEFHRTLRVRLDEPALDAPLDNLPRLYQQWGTLQVVAAAVEIASRAGFRVLDQRLVRTDPAGGAFLQILPGGSHALATLRHAERDLRLRIYAERTYTSGSAPLRSVSFAQRPDIALELERLGAPPVVLLLDPKYKLDGEAQDDPDDVPRGTPKKVDVDKMHAYRDAIRTVEGARVVRFAATLYPGETVRYAASLAALRAVPGALGDVLGVLEEVLGAMFAEGIGSTQRIEGAG